MDDLRQYLLSVTAAALVCALAARLLPKSGTAASVGKMVMGLFLALTVISPWATLQVGQLTDLTFGTEQNAAQAVAEGKEYTRTTLQDIIKEQAEAYILDKAEQLALRLTVSVTVSDADIPVPVAVRLQGAASPYAKGQLQTAITEDLGIAKEDQLWT